MYNKVKGDTHKKEEAGIWAIWAALKEEEEEEENQTDVVVISVTSVP